MQITKFFSTTFILLFVCLPLSFIFAQTVNIKIIETSDIHGALLPYDLTNDIQTTSSLAQVYSYVFSQRKLKDQEVVLLDNGDLIQGDPMSYYYNFEDTTSTHIFADALNFMGYNAATIGNHDIETGHAVYDRFRSEINLLWLAANAVRRENNEPYFNPYTIIERGGVKIAIIGLITPAIPGWLPEKLWSGIRFDDMVESAKYWLKIIKEKESPNLVVGLFHSGVDYTYGGDSEETYKNENASRLVAEKVPGFDVVFVGHDHAGWNFKTVNLEGDSVLIVGPLSRARTIAVANIEMQFDSLGGKWIQKKLVGEIVETKDYNPDDSFVNIFSDGFNVVKKYVQKPLGEILKTISSRESMFGPSEYVDLIHTTQLEISGADISFSSPLSFNATIESGKICVGDMFKLYHYENFLYTMELSGKEIKDYLEYSYNNWFNQMKDEDDHLLKFKFNNDGTVKFSEHNNVPELEERYYNYSSAAGINYVVDVTKPAGERVSISTLTNGTKFETDKKYKVAINSYRGNGGGGHLTRGSGIPEEELPNRVINSTEKDLRYYIMRWIEEKKIIDPEIISTWKVVPETWWEKGREKDYKLLFGTEAPVLEKQSVEFDYK